MRLLKWIGLTLAALVAVFLVGGLLLPAEAHVQRSVVIDAPQCTVFAIVNNLEGFNRWSPWFDRDPEAVYTFEGPGIGAGSRMTWSSDNPDVGSGSQEIVANEPFRLVWTRLDFGEQGAADGFFALAPTEGGTRLTWGFDTDFGANLLGRWVGLFFDAMVGPDFEAGLANIRSLAESLPDADWSMLEVRSVDVAARPLVWVAGRAPMDHSAVGEALARAYHEVVRVMEANGLEQDGPPVAITTGFDPGTGWSFRAGIPVATAPPNGLRDAGEVQLGSTRGGPALRAVHTGPYTGLAQTHAKLEAYLAAYDIGAGEGLWEEYVSDPTRTPAAQLVTLVYVPLS